MNGLAVQPSCRRYGLAVAIGGLLVFAALFFYPPFERAIGGVVSYSSDSRQVAKYPERLRQQMTQRDSVYLTYPRIPGCLDRAVMSVEDKRFLQHGGIDAFALFRALLQESSSDRIDHGGSTITQQLARIVLDLPHRRSTLWTQLADQLRITAAAFILEHDFSKATILELYLNSAYFGRGATGVATAAHAYLGGSVQKLTQGECIYLAGLLQSPTPFGNDPGGERSMARYRHVIATMERNDYLTGAEAAALDKGRLVFATRNPAEP